MKRKRERFRIIEQRANVIEPSKAHYSSIRGRWNSFYFQNENPITVELACGRGEYTTGLATICPEKNFIGVDRKGDRIWKGSTVAEEQGLLNAAFLRAEILSLEHFFAPGEISELWLPFPDPHPGRGKYRRRITGPRFLEMYKRLLVPGSFIRLKTDNPVLYGYTLEQLCKRNDVVDLQHTDDVDQSSLKTECQDIVTRYETQFSVRGETIKYLRFRFDGGL